MRFEDSDLGNVAGVEESTIKYRDLDNNGKHEHV